MADSSSGDGAGESSLEVDANELLLEACKAGDVERLREAIAAGANVDARLPHSKAAYKSQTPLCAVVHNTEVKRNRAEKGRTACVQVLLDAGASASAAAVLDGHEKPLCTALHLAAYSGLDTICRLLLDAGVDLNARTQTDCTSLHYALIFRRHRTVVLFLSRGAATDGETDSFEECCSRGLLSRISKAGGFANYQKQQRATLMAMLAPKMSHLLPPELVSHVITFWGHLGWN